MRFKELLSERRQQKTEVLFHGTTTAFLKSILQQGLRHDVEHRSFVAGVAPSLGGVYLTSQIAVALDAAEEAASTHGGEEMLIYVQYVEKSGGLDEDTVFSELVEIGIEQWLAKNPVSDATNIGLQKYNQHTGVTAQSKQLMSDLYNTLYKICDASNLRKSVAPIWKKVSWVESKSEMIDRLHALINVSKASTKKNTEVRVRRPITFRGKTRIIQIKNLKTGQIYYKDPTVSTEIADRRADYYK